MNVAVCPTADQLAAFLRGEVSPIDLEMISSHLRDCATCLTRMGELDADLGAPLAGLRSAETPVPLGDTSLQNAVAALLGSQQSAITVGPGTRLGHYILGERLGEGGMGIVFAAEQVAPIRRAVAIKVVKPQLAGPAILQRFEAERQALALMDHPNIARIIDADAFESLPFFVMEFVRGVPLGQYCEKHRPSLADRVALFRDVCRAVQHAHQKGIIHRDLKPSNILVADVDGVAVPKVIDFGVAKAMGPRLGSSTLHTDIGAVIGTLEYLSPEQAAAEEIDTRSDIYALGLILYSLLTDSLPFSGARLRQIPLLEALHVIREEEPMRPSVRLKESKHPEEGRVRGDLDWITMKCLEKDRSRRYATAEGLAVDLERHLRDEPVLAGPPTTGYRLGKFIRRNRIAAGSALVIMVTLIVGVLGTSIGLWKALQSERRARKANDQASTERDVSNAIRSFFQSDLLLQASSIRQARANHAPSPNLTLREALDRAARQVPGKFDKHPLIEAGIRQTIGDAYRELGQYAAAEPHLERAVELYGELGADDVRLTDAINSLGLLRLYQARFDEAERLFLRVKESYDRTVEPTGIPSMSNKVNLASAAMGQGRLAEAELLLTDVVAVGRTHLKSASYAVGGAVSKLATIHGWRGDFNKGAEMMREQHAAFSAALGPDHLDTAEMTCRLCSFLIETGEDAEVERLAPAVRKVLVQALGPNSPQVAEADRLMARLAHRRGDLAKAESLNSALLESTRVHSGADHSITLSIQYHLAVIYHDRREFKKAYDLMQRTLEVQERTFGPMHTETLQTVSSHAGICLALGELDKAEALAVRALEGRRFALGQLTPGTVHTQQNLANLLAIRGRFLQAIDLLTPVLEYHRAQHGPDSNQAIGAMRTMGVLLQDAGKNSESEAVLRQYLQIVQAAPDGKPQFSADARYLLGKNLVRQGKMTEAEPFLREAVALLEKRKSQSYVVPHVRSLLGQTLTSQAKYMEAEPWLLEGYRGLVEKSMLIPRQDRGWIADAKERIVQLYDAWGQSEKAAEWRAKKD